jgi:periplasmic protein CpxP/Spy
VYDHFAKEAEMSHFRWSILASQVVLLAGLLFGHTSQSPQTSMPQSQGATAHRHAESPEQHLQMLSEKLNLTDEQKTTLKPILEDQAQQMKAIHADTSLSEEQKRDKMKAIHETFHDKIKSLLTAEQQVKFKQMKHEHRGMKEDKVDKE